MDHPIIGADFLRRFGLLPDLKHRRLIDPETQFYSVGTLSFDNIPTLKHFEIVSDFQSLLSEFRSLTEEPDYSVEPKHFVVHHIITKEHLQVTKARQLNSEKFMIAKHEFARFF